MPFIRATLTPFLFLLLCSGCASVIGSAAGDLADQLGRATRAADDPQLVASALPAYMLLLDGMLLDDPESSELQMGAAKLYSAYAGLFVSDSARQKKLAHKGYLAAVTAVCLEDEDWCKLTTLPFDQFQQMADEIVDEDTELAFNLALSWAGYIQAASDDWKVVANLSKVQYLLESIATKQPDYGRGDVQLYLGIIKSLVPPALGGKPEIARQHFERARQYSDGENLAVEVAIAEHYARAVFDRKLHDQLLTSVLNSQVQSDEFRLSNQLAKLKAQKLLESADEFF